MKSVAIYIVMVFNFIVFFYFALINTVYLGLFFAAFVGSIKYNRHRRFVDLHEVFRSPLTPSISVLVPAFNEEATISEVLLSILQLEYPHFEVIVINDGSTDRTLELLGEKYGLRRIARFVPPVVPCQPIRGVFVSPENENLLVVDKENGGKADALNAGINVSSHDLVCVIDADSIIEPEGLLKVARPFIDNPTTTVATGGLIRIVNGCTVENGEVTSVHLPENYVANLQIVEYLRAYLGGRIGWSVLRCLLIISGAFGLFDRRLAIEVNGYRRDTVGEDMDLVVRMHRRLRKTRRKYRIYFVPDPVCWTEAPEKIKQLGRQRDRWQRGLIETLTGSMGMLMNPRYGRIGLFAMPFYFLFEMIGPAIEIFGYFTIVLALILGLLSAQFFYLFLCVAFLYAITVSMFAVMLEGVVLKHYPSVPALLKLGFYSIAENLGYRQLNAWWRTKAFYTLFTKKQSWAPQERRGYEEGAEWKEAADAAPAVPLKKRLVPVLVVMTVIFLVVATSFVVVSVTRVDRTVRPAPMQAAGAVDIAARAQGRYFSVYNGSGWNQYLVRGINVGTALPGTWSTEFPADSDLYRSWFEEIANLDANTLRVYTLLDPVFYRTLYDFNESSPKKLMLLQEIWPGDTVPGDNLYDQQYFDSYRDEISMDVAALAGRENIPERENRAYGDYNADVTPYVLGVMIGREFDAGEVGGTDAANPGKNGYGGSFVSAPDGSSATETWCAQMCDYTVQRMAAGGWGAPVAFVSWPTLDPMTHPTEATPGVPKSEEPEDSQVLDPNHIQPQSAPAGLFGCYDIYPYYPDFMNTETRYAEYRDDQGVLRYGGYLEQFMSIHPDYPALVGEFGMATSMEVAHLNPDGLNQGGTSETQQGQQDARMYRAVVQTGYAGGAIFEWVDEWDKAASVDMDYVIPYDRHIFWHNMLDPEQNYGLLAFDLDPPEQMNSYWVRGGEPGAADGIEVIKVNHDEAFTYLEVDFERPLAKELLPGAESDLELNVGIDTMGKDNGTVVLPVDGLPRLPGGVEFLLRINSKDGALLLAVPDYNRGTSMFAASPTANPDFVHIVLLTNIERMNTLDGAVIPAEYTDDSMLRYGNYLPTSREYDSQASWFASSDGTKLYVRLPWLLLNVSDPSSLTVLHDDRTDLPQGPRALSAAMGTDSLHTGKTEGFSFYAATTRAGKLADFEPRSGGAWATVNGYLWSSWNEPRYTQRQKQSCPEIKSLFSGYANQ